MNSEQKITAVMKILKDKADISAENSEISYRAGEETFDLTAQEEISILNKLASEGFIEVTGNFGSDFV
jgi:hypothetical protein